MTQEEFINKAIKKHGNRYDYSKVAYTNCKNKVCIICSEHGEFWQTPDNHLRKNGCPKCGYKITSQKLSCKKEEFICKSKEIHGDKYDYSKVEYINNRTKVCIICPKHGEFWQTPETHLRGCGCPYCSKNHKYSTEEFIAKIKEIWKDEYDFSQVKYEETHKKVKVICPKHGEFWQSPHNLLKGIGCNQCNESKMERNIRQFLESQKIKFIYEYKDNKDFHRQTIDFYLPDYNIGIECQGIQHFKPIDFAGKGEDWGEKNFLHIQELDKNKYVLCESKKIKILYYIEPHNMKIAKLQKFYIDKEIIQDPYQIKRVLNLMRAFN